jgi:D-sedoheptulose 7-phosphate isomerase
MKSNLGLVIGLSTSGKSKNVLEGLKKAKDLGIATVFMTGNTIDYLEIPYVDYMLNVESSLTPRIQEVHLLWGHALAELVEELFI